MSDADDPAGAVACLRDAVAPGSYLAISPVGAEFFPDKAAMAQAKAVYERASEPVWARSRDEILGFFDGFELLEPGLVPKRQWRSVTGQAGTGTPNLQWGVDDAWQVRRAKTIVRVAGTVDVLEGEHIPPGGLIVRERRKSAELETSPTVMTPAVWVRLSRRRRAAVAVEAKGPAQLMTVAAPVSARSSDAGSSIEADPLSADATGCG